MGYDNTLRAFENLLNLLQTDYIDVYLIHWPASKEKYDNWEEVNSNTWKALVRLYHEGRVKKIDVSNFMVKHLMSLKLHNDILPMINQIEFHLGFYWKEVAHWCKKHEIKMQGWGALGNGEILNNK